MSAKDVLLIKAKRLLEVAECPECDGSGGKYGEFGRPHQCRWCSEVTDFLLEFDKIKTKERTIS